MSCTRLVVLILLGLGCSLNVYAAEGSTKEKAKEVKTETLKVGDEAPDFELKGSDGKTYKLSDFKEKSAVIVAWYPMALTGG